MRRRERRPALMIMKAFPLEHEGTHQAGEPPLPGFAARRRAMVRYYCRLFGVQPLPGIRVR